MIGHKLAFGLLLAFTSAAAAKPNEFIEAQVKALGRRYNEIEEQLPRSVRYLQTQQDGNATVVKQAWFDGADDPVKVTVERTEGATRELLEYVALNSGEPYNGLFVVGRKESPLADGGVEVSESRRYFG